MPHPSGARVDEPHAVLLDLDGTFLDANQSIRQTMNQVLAEKGQATFKQPELDALIGQPLREILAAKVTDPGLVEPMALRYRVVYGESGWTLAQPFPGLVELLADLRLAGWKVGAVTSKGEHEAETALFDLGVLQLFDTVVGDDDRRPLKPHPDPVLEAARRLGIRLSHVAMVGDTRFDVASARAAGVLALGVLWGNGSRDSLVQAGAHACAATPAELRRLLVRWSNA